MLGGFYMAKAFLHCNCKFIKINCLSDTLKETSTFGIKTAEKIVGGTNMEDHFVECGYCKRLY